MEPLEDRRLLTCVVNNANDDANNPAEGTLRYCVESGEEEVVIAGDIGTITLEDRAVLISTEVTIRPEPILESGGGVATISGGDVTRIFRIDDGSAMSQITVRLENLLLTAGTGTEIPSNGTNGGAIYNDGEDLILDGVTVAQNTAVEGGGIFSTNGGSVSISNSSVFSNSSSDDGGGLRMEDGTLLIDSSSSFLNNIAGALGGAASLGLDPTGVTAEVFSSTFNGNTGFGGGAIHLDSGSLTIDDVTIIGNETTTIGGGGILNLHGSSIDITDSIISSNTAVAVGGGLNNGGMGIGGLVTVSGSQISGNIASEGGGIFSNSPATLMIDRSTISDNTASDTAGGGGISIASSSTLVIDSSTVSDNVATYGGGGINLRGTLEMSASSLSGNSVTSGRGGGLRSAGAGALLTIEQSTFSQNSASDRGGGLFIAAPNEIALSTFTLNSSGSEGGGITASVVDVNLENSIVSGNDAPVDPDIDLLNNAALSESFSMIGGDAGLDVLANNGGPTLVHCPQGNSVVIDAGDPGAMAGVNETPFFDQRGMPFGRVEDGDGIGGPRIDMGAVEFQSVNCVDADLNDDGQYNGMDIDLLMAEIAAGNNGSQFDLTSDGFVNALDRDEWLAEAGAMNLLSGNAYLLGDANLNGIVDGLDFILWNEYKFTANSAWTRGNFTADGVIDGLDFIAWNTNKFMTVVSLSTQISFEMEADSDKENKDNDAAEREGRLNGPVWYFG